MLSTAVLVGLAWQTVATAQTAPAPTATPAPTAAPAAPAAKAAKPAPAPGPVDTSPLGRYVARENLVFYMEFAGLDAHADAWKKTAAYRMLTSTPLGEMLEDVAGQLFERLLDSSPNRKLTGPEVVTIIEQMTRRGWLLALNSDPKAARQLRGTLILRGAVVKENKPLFGRLVGSFMGVEAKPKIERKSGRVMVVVPPEEGAPADSGWIWWPEKDDLVIGFFQTSDTPIPSVLDGKTPSALEHPLVAELKKPDGAFTPVLTAFVDPAGCPAGATNPLVQQIAKLDSQANVKRLDYRWGFEDESLVGVTRLSAPKPRKGPLAFFDKPAADPKSILPVPDGIEYFASLSLKPEQVTELFSDSLGGGPVKAKFDQFVENLRSRSRVDLQKDLLAHLGPRIMLYMAPGGASAVVDEAPANPGAPPGARADVDDEPKGMNPAALLKQFGPQVPKPVLVAEVNDPVKFAKALDALMVEVNRALKAEVAEQAADAAKAAAAEADAARGPGAAPPPAERKARGRDNDSLAPEFRMIPGATKIYMFIDPPASQTKVFPRGVKPTIRLEGKHVAFSTSPQAAREAIESLHRKSWAPSPDLERSLSKLSPNTVLLLYGDSRETTPTILASLPGTLQTLVNTAIATAARVDAASQAGQGGPGGPGGPGGAGSYPPGMMTGMSRGSGGPGGPAGRPGGPGFPGAPGYGGNSPQAPGSTEPTMLQIKVDPAKLPKADDLKALMFPSTFAVVADDETIQFVTRGAFPDLAVGTATTGIASAIAMPGLIAARNAARAAQEAKEAKAAEAAGNQPGAPGAPPLGMPGIGQPPGRPPQPGQPGGGSPGPGKRGRSG